MIVLSLFGIVIFLVKKAPAAAHLQNHSDNEGPVKERRKFFWLEKTARGILLFPEKIGKGLKFIFVKLISAIIQRSKRKEAKKKEQTPSFRQSGGGREKLMNLTKKESLTENQDLEVEIRRPGRNERIQGKKDAFEKILIERIALNPKDVEAYERLGEYYMEIENWNYSKECFKQVLKLSPDNENIRTKMKKLETILGGK